MSLSTIGTVIAAVVIFAVILALLNGRSKRDILEGPPVGLQPSAAAVAAPSPSLALSTITAGDVAELKRWLASETLPALRLDVDPTGPAAAGGTRIGGPVWLAAGEAWPTDRAGEPLEFVAQVDFAAMPALPDFPTSGILQFFLGRDRLFGADLADPIQGNARVIWRPETSGGALHPPPAQPALSPFGDAKARAEGQLLAATRFEDMVDENSREAIERLAAFDNKLGMEAIDEVMDAHCDTRGFCHQVGGFPTFSNDDFRKPGHYDDYDRLLLRLTSDDDTVLTWGDGLGEALFMITSDDLARRDFSRTIFRWDAW